MFINSPDAQNVVQLPARKREIGTVEQRWNTVLAQWDYNSGTVEQQLLNTLRSVMACRQRQQRLQQQLPLAN